MDSMANTKFTPDSNKQSNLDDNHLDILFSSTNSKIEKEIIYRKNGKAVDKVIETDKYTGTKVRTTHFDYFNDNKIRSIDEYDLKSGKKIRTINYVLYKSIDEYDIESGKKIRTINYSIKDENKLSSIQEYNIETGNIISMTIYKRDGKTISVTKNIDPVTGKITNWLNNKNKSYQPIESKNFLTRTYDRCSPLTNQDNIAELIDNLYNNIEFEKTK